MKGLSKFQKFDTDGFLAGKTLVCVASSEWKDYKSGEHMGTKIETVIMRDTTDYGKPDVTNRYEKLSVKVRKDAIVPEDAIVTLVNPTGVVYGEYRNMLSITADDVQIHQPSAPKRA